MPLLTSGLQELQLHAHIGLIIKRPQAHPLVSNCQYQEISTINFQLLATANVAGLISYFLNVPEHWNRINSATRKPKAGSFPSIVKRYLNAWAHARGSGANYYPVLYNAAIPQNYESEELCHEGAAYAKKREAADATPTMSLPVSVTGSGHLGSTVFFSTPTIAACVSIFLDLPSTLIPHLPH